MSFFMVEPSSPNSLIHLLVAWIMLSLSRGSKHIPSPKKADLRASFSKKRVFPTPCLPWNMSMMSSENGFWILLNNPQIHCISHFLMKIRLYFPSSVSAGMRNISYILFIRSIPSHFTDFIISRTGLNLWRVAYLVI